MTEFYIINDKPELRFQSGFGRIIDTVENALYGLSIDRALNKAHEDRKIYKVSGELKFEEVVE